MEEGKLGWAAGIIDGEGSIFVSKRKENGNRNAYYHLIIQIGTTTPKILKPFKSLWGGSIMSVDKPRYTNIPLKRKCKPQWIWRASANDAAKCLTDICDYLVLKKPQALLGLRFQHKQKGIRKGRTKKITLVELQFRESCHRKMKKLNGGR